MKDFSTNIENNFSKGVGGGTLLERRRAYGGRAVQRKYADLSAEPCILSNRQNTIQVPLDSKKTKVILGLFGVGGGTWTPTDFSTRPSNVRVYHSATPTYNYLIFNAKTMLSKLLAFCASTPLTKQYSIVLFGRVPHRHITI